MVRHKVRRVLADAQFPPDSHNGRTLIDILENFPRDELLQIDQRRLYDWSMTLIDLGIAAPRDRADAARRYGPLHVRARVRAARSLLLVGARAHRRLPRKPARREGGRRSTPTSARARWCAPTSSSSARTPAAPSPDEELEAGIVETHQDLGRAARRWRLERTAGTAAQSGRGLIRRRVLRWLCRNVPRRAGGGGYRAHRAAWARSCLSRSISIATPRRPRTACAPRSTASTSRLPCPSACRFWRTWGSRSIDERSYRIRPRLGGAVRDVVLHDMVLETPDGAPIDLARHEARLEEAIPRRVPRRGRERSLQCAGARRRVRLARGGGDARAGRLHAPDARAVRPALHRRDAGRAIR